MQRDGVFGASTPDNLSSVGARVETPDTLDRGRRRVEISASERKARPEVTASDRQSDEKSAFMCVLIEGVKGLTVCFCSSGDQLTIPLVYLFDDIFRVFMYPSYL